MTKREKEKARVRASILQAASEMIRESGVAGLTVGALMERIGLTHGTFYAHFDSKEELVEEAFHHAFDHRDAWIAAAGRSAKSAESALLTKYLTKDHRDRPEAGCAFAVLAREFAEHGGPLSEAFASELRVSIERIADLLDDGGESDERAIGLLSLCVGGMLLSRAVGDDPLSDQVLKAAAKYARPAKQKE